MKSQIIFTQTKKVSKANLHLITTLTKAMITNDVGDDKNKINIWKIRDQDGTTDKLTKYPEFVIVRQALPEGFFLFTVFLILK